MSIWIIVGVTLDIFLCVSFPSKLNIFTDRKKLFWVYLGVFIVLLLLNIPNLFFKLIQKDDSIVCSSTNSLVVFIRNMEISIFRALVPAILHIVLSAILIKDLLKSKRNVITNHNEKRECKFTLIVVASNVFFCLTELPLSIITILLGILGFTPAYPKPKNLTYSLALTSVVYHAAFFFRRSLLIHCFLSILCSIKYFKRS
jgi:hypothetical protein